MYIKNYIVVGLWKSMKDYFSFCYIKDNHKQYNYTAMNILYIVSNKTKEYPLQQYNEIRNVKDENIIVSLHFAISYYFNNTEKEYISVIFLNNKTIRININQLFDLFMNYVYIPSYTITNKINKYLFKIKKNYIIGMHIRTGINTDFKEYATWFGGINSTNKFIEIGRNISKYNNNTKWIVCTDSSHISKFIKQQNRKHILDYKIYFNYPSLLKHSRDYILKPYNIYASSVLIEIELLSKCNYLLLSKGSMVSKLSYIRNKNCKRNISRCIFIGKNSDFYK